MAAAVHPAPDGRTATTARLSVRIREWAGQRPRRGKRERTARYDQGSRYRVADIPGVRVKSFDTLEDAKTWLRQAGTDSERGEFVDPRAGSIALAEYVVHYWQAGVQGAPGTVKRIDERVRLHVRPHLGAVSLRDITPTVPRGYIATLVRELSPRYARQILFTLSNILDFTLPKGGRNRVVDMPASAASALAEYFMEYPAVEVELPWAVRSPTVRGSSSRSS
ncbi:hypothetical protein PZB75_26550 [Streptomyces sp. AM 4-1-1]|uniref:hypothetical protein n=1 Tax=Streptomyces sp. AM 4-1-1 TaxID=3028710 RepID=UPI0023B8F0BC|nr:hypothetical protein [Streptomyces sp. AM 4-1-1]WEH36600.1 hypothetical protein PZB75_26550 [Streptomyces sp. AM 4-1-1]